MIKSAFFLCAFLLSAQFVQAQNLKIEKEEWVAKPSVTRITGQNLKEPAVVILDKRRMEYIDEAKDELVAYYTLHKIIHINDDRGIENFNKIYLDVNDNSDIVDIKARNILPGGKVIELDKSNIKDIKDKDENTFKIFAMDGLEKGCDVEFFYTYKRSASFFGREVLQGSLPVLQAVFQIVAPKRLRFEVKAYNATALPTDTLINDKRILECRLTNMAGAEDEKYADYYTNLQRLEYKLSYNDATTKGERLFTWNQLAKRIYGIYTDYSAKELKAVTDLVQKNGWTNLPDETLKITTVENFIKKTISYNEDIKSDQENTLEHVLQNKNGGITGVMRLYSAVFETLGIKYQFVLTGDRERYVIDKAFENWNNCDYPVIYFPAENKFMAPTRADYRYPWILPAWGAANGLFCKHTSLGNFSTAIAEIKPIALEDYTKTTQNIETRLTFSKDLDSLIIDGKQLLSGYASPTYRDVFNYANDDQKNDFIKELTKSYYKTDNVAFSEALNPSFEDQSLNKPLIIHTIVHTDALIERAGNKLLLKIGMAIGPQVEMYQEKPRQQAVDMGFGHVEERKLEVVIPDGYKINNLDELKIDQTYKENGELTMGFVTDYQLNGNILTIHIMEQYRNNIYPLSQFDQFKKVINASSDFNKVVLILDKK